MKPMPHAGFPARRGERGFALLIVFLMAAAVALLLYRQIPRVAFESQRDKEQLLIEHGEQYKRAIQLYFVAFKKYPSKIEDLENTNNQRFLRRRFIDPMTGKDQWRLIHVNAAGALTDSLVQKPPAPLQSGGSTTPGPGSGTATGVTTGGGNNGANGGTNTFTNSPNTFTNSPNTFTNSPNTFTNSPNTATNSPNAATNSPNTATNSGTGSTNGNDPNQPPEVNAAVLRRPSDRPMVSPNGLAANTDVDPNDPRYWPPITLAQPVGAQTGAQPGVQQPGLQQPGLPPGVPSGLLGAPNALANPQGFVPQFPGQQFAGQQYPGQPNPALLNSTQPGATPQDPSALNPQNPNPAYPSQVSSGQYNAQPVMSPVQTGYQGAPGTAASGMAASGVNNSGVPGNGAPGSAALAAINSMLTTPRQAPPPTPDASGSAMNAGGLAGVASTYAAPSIKVYKDRHKYNEWEFIFDLKSGLPGQQPPATPPPTPGQSPTGQGTPGQGTGGQNSGQSNSTFGPSTTFGQSTTFGSTSGSGAPAPPQ